MVFVVECGTIQNGGFLEYFVQGYGDLELQAGLEDDLMLEFIDIRNRKLVIPCVETGEPARVTMTSLRDIANFVAASLDLPRGVMTGQIGIAGWTGTFENVVDVLERLEPAVEVEKVYVTAEECRNMAEEHRQTFRVKIGKGEFDLAAFRGEMVAQMYAVLCGEEDSGGMVCGKTLNELCPDVETANLKELLHKAWQRRSAASC
ncbi:hypothetical protein LTR51_008721 [Lithohypha guttulata]|nr:hypothetical protein LTR51_008721 [Lithohypha guttulata]